MKNIIVMLSCFALLSCQNVKKTGSENNESIIALSDASNDTVEKKEIAKKISFKDSLRYEIVRFYKTTTKSTNPKDSGQYAYVKAVYPLFESNQIFLNKKIISIVSAEPWTGNKTYSMEKAATSFFKEYLEFKKDYPDSPAGYTWDENVKVSFQDTDLVVLTNESYVYTGGAHGMESIIYHNLDLKNQKELGISDLLIDNYTNKLTDIAESVFRKDEGLTETEPLIKYFFENDIFKLSDNFAITNKGLLFTYNPYEIKAYAFGTTDLLIPYSKIKSLIKPNSFISKYIYK